MKKIILALVALTALGSSAALALAPVPAGSVNAAACNVDSDGCCCEPCQDCTGCCLQ